MLQGSQRKATSKWAEEKPKFDAAREQWCIYYISKEDLEYADMMNNASAMLRKVTTPANPNGSSWEATLCKWLDWNWKTKWLNSSCSKKVREDIIIESQWIRTTQCRNSICGTHHTFYNELRDDAFIHAVCLCSAVLVTLYIQTHEVPELVWEPLTVELKTSLTHLRVCDRCLHVPSFCQWRLGLQFMRLPRRHRTSWKFNCARADGLTGNSRGSGGGKNPHLIRTSGPVERRFMLAAIHLFFSAHLFARCTACPSVRLFHPDDSSSSAFSRLRTFAHPSVSRFTFQWQTLHKEYNNNSWGPHRGPRSRFHVAQQNGAQTDFHFHKHRKSQPQKLQWTENEWSEGRKKQCLHAAWERTQHYILLIEHHHNSELHRSYTFQVQESHQTYHMHRTFQNRFLYPQKTLGINGNRDPILQPK